MDSDSKNNRRNSTRLMLDPPTFVPSVEMRAGYLDRRKREVDEMLEHGRAGEWKPVMMIVNQVRGTGAMYGFANIGSAAEEVMRAVQNGDDQSMRLLEEYVSVVNASYV